MSIPGLGPLRALRAAHAVRFRASCAPLAPLPQLRLGSDARLARTRESQRERALQPVAA